jgi:MFS family permease
VRILLVQFCSGVAYSTFFLLPRYLLAERKDAAWLLGATQGAFAIASLALTPFVGQWLDTGGRKRVLHMSLCLGTLSYGLFGFFEQPLLLIALRAVHGVAFAMTFNASAALTADVAPLPLRARAIGYFGSSGMIATALGPPVGEWIGVHLGWQFTFCQASLWALIGLALARGIATPEGARQPPGNDELRYTRPLLLGYLGGFALGAGVAVTQNYGPALLLGLGGTATAPLFVAFMIGAIVQRVLFGFVPDKLGAGPAASASLLVYGIGLLAMALAGTPSLVITLALLVGVAHGTAYPALSALTLRGVSTTRRGRVTAQLTGAFSLGLALGTAGLAPLADSVGFRPLIACGAVVVLGSALALALQRSAVAAVESSS